MKISCTKPGVSFVFSYRTPNGNSRAEGEADVTASWTTESS